MPLLPSRIRPLSGKVEPCLPRLAKEPPAGPDWIHEIKHDGFRIMARRDGSRVRLKSGELVREIKTVNVVHDDNDGLVALR
jgi:ATP-dependent DNA ligase